MSEKIRDEGMIAALKRERAGYVARGLGDRVAEVDEQLKTYGYEGEQDAVVDPSGAAPKGRTGRAGRQRTADAETGTQDPAKPADKTTGAAGPKGKS